LLDLPVIQRMLDLPEVLDKLQIQGTKGFHLALFLAQRLDCTEAVRVLQALLNSTELVVPIPISSDFKRRWERLRTLRVNLPLHDSIASTMNIHDGLSVEYQEALRQRLVPAQVMIEQLLVGMKFQQSRTTKALFMLLRLVRAILEFAIVVGVAALPMILRGIPEGLGHLEFPPAKIKIVYMELVWVLAVVRGLRRITKS